MFLLFNLWSFIGDVSADYYLLFVRVNCSPTDVDAEFLIATANAVVLRGD
jgi:hypothetical protein